jgi:hypothetical protein
MESTAGVPNDIKKVFMKKGACSHTGYFVLNREFGFNKPNEERASDLLAGGLANKGYQCGMLWGCALSTGAQCYRQCSNLDNATSIAISTTQKIISSFEQKTGTPNCKEITHCNFSSPFGLVKYLIINVPRGLTNSVCFNVAEQWLPEAARLAQNEITKEQKNPTDNAISCASQVVKLLGGNDEEAATVAGFAGGLGLSGNACGALAATVWFGLLSWCRGNPGKMPSYFNNKIVKRILKNFFKVTGNKILCEDICGRTFKTVDEHTEFVKKGGCVEVINALTVE